jgi:DNA-binding CsgD family transcriptional regulator/exonuclease VII small subunit
MPLVEREAELAAVDAALSCAVAGAGSLLIVQGPAGIGKTALLDEARRRAGDPERPGGPLRTLLARGTPLERELAHGVARQLLEPPVRAAAPDRRDILLSGAADFARPVVLPESGDIVADDPVADRRAPVVHGLYWLAANLAAQAPLLLAIDDLQWCDPASLRLLAYLALRLDGLRIAVVATMRAGDATGDDRTLDELATGPVTTVLRPEPLSTNGVARLVHDRLPGAQDPALPVACREATGGVPFLVEALLGALAKGPSAPSPASVGRVTSATVGHATLLRLSRIDPAAVRVARAVAVLGRLAGTGRIARLTGLDEASVLRGTDALAAADILRPGHPPAFVHPIVRSSVYEEMPAGERWHAHAEAARLLAADGESDEEVAIHLMATEPGAVTGGTATLRAAATQARQRGAPESAIAYLRRCLVEPGLSADRPGVLHELARAEAVQRDEAAVGHFEQAMQLASGPAQQVRLARDLVETLMFAGRWDRALAEVDRALTADDDPERAGGRAADDRPADPQDIARLEVFRAGMMANDPRLIDRFEYELPRLEAVAAREGRAGALMAALLASCAVCRGEPAARVADLIDRGLVGTGLMASADADAWGPQVAASLAYLGELDRATAAAEAMRVGARERGSVYGFVRAVALRALVADLRGDLRAVEADLRSALDLSRVNELMFSVPPLLRWSIDALLERAQLEDIVSLVEGIGLDPALSGSFSGAWLLETRGRLRLARGDLPGATEDLEACGRTMIRLHVTNPTVSGWRSALALALRDADPERARALVAEELAAATVTGLSRPIGIALRGAGLLAQGEERESRLREAVHVLRDGEASLELARTEHALGASLRRQGHRTAAEAPLRAALDGAHRCGADRLAARVEAELHAIGARPRRRALSGPESLTPSEVRVAAQAAGGMTNREIAQALFVTAKTVENQLSRVYAKLGVRGRDELAAAMSVPVTAEDGIP